MSATKLSGHQSRTAAPSTLSTARGRSAGTLSELAQGFDAACVSSPTALLSATCSFLDPTVFADLVNAIEAGRDGRGRPGMAWGQLRAFVLACTAKGMLRARIAGVLGFSTQRVTQLREEGCEAVLRGELKNLEAETACHARWQRWCYSGDADACARVACTAAPESG